MFTAHTNEGYQTVLDGIQIKTLVVGERSLLSKFHLEKGHPLPRHAHTLGAPLRGALRSRADISFPGTCA
jgi:hypothetical protein